MVLGRHIEYFPMWTKVGWAGVDLFFVLSGFLISGLLFTEWKTHHTISLSRFYIRRGLKLYPGLYVLLAATAGVEAMHTGFTPHPVNSVSIAVEALFLQNYFRGIWGYTWSLAIEEHFYLALPMILLVMQSFDKSVDPFRHIPKLSLIICCVALLLRVSLAWKPEQYFHLVQTPFRIDGLLFGVTLSYYRVFHPRVFERISTSIGVLPAGMIAMATLMIAPVENPLVHTLGFTVVFLGFGLLLSRAVDFTPGPYTSTVIRSLANIGIYSYSIYLWHVPVMRFAHYLQPNAGLRYFGLAMTLAIVWGIIAAKLIELPVLAFRDRIFPAKY